MLLIANGAATVICDSGRLGWLHLVDLPAWLRARAGLTLDGTELTRTLFFGYSVGSGVLITLVSEFAIESVFG